MDVVIQMKQEEFKKKLDDLVEEFVFLESQKSAWDTQDKLRVSIERHLGYSTARVDEK